MEVGRGLERIVTESSRDSSLLAWRRPGHREVDRHLVELRGWQTMPCRAPRSRPQQNVLSPCHTWR
eukprot:1948683-Pyramimonas_sp.AAC.1